MAYREKSQAERFEEQVRGEDYWPAEEDIQEFCEQEGAEIDRFLGRTNDETFAGCDKRDGRVLDGERDARLRHGASYDRLIEGYVVPVIHRRPEVFKILRDMPLPAEAAFTLGKLLENPSLASRQEYKDFQEILQFVADNPCGRFDDLTTPEAFEKALQDYKENAGDETIAEYFSIRK
jgi:hypothetical protein